MMAQRTAQMEKMKKIVVCDILLVSCFGTWGSFKRTRLRENSVRVNHRDAYTSV